MTWDEIKALYDKARNCLWCPKGVQYWSIDYENGLYFLSAALRKARQMPEKDHLTYARILSMYGQQNFPVKYEFETFTKYLLPALFFWKSLVPESKLAVLRTSGAIYE